MSFQASRSEPDPRDWPALVAFHAGFVHQTARRFEGRGVDLDDLLQVAFLGMLEAAMRFDPGRGVKFISYAVWWMRQAIGLELANSARPVRLPLAAARRAVRLRQARGHLTARLGRPPAPEELARETGLPLGRVEELLRADAAPLSLDAPPHGGEGEGLTAGDFLPDPRPDPGEGALAQLQRGAILLALAKLEPRQGRIIRLYFGLEGEREHTLQEIGDMLGLTRERIRQLRDRALQDLRLQLGGWA